MSDAEAKRLEAYRDNERLRAAMPQRRVGQASQIWRARDEAAQKKGNCQTVYWVKPKPKEQLQITRPTRDESGKWVVSSSYKGGWLNNKHHGFGIKIWSNGNKYEGEFASGMRQGRGTFWVRDTKIAKGQNIFRSTGNSILENSSGTSASNLDDDKNLRRVYTGNWANDEKDGLGTQFYIDGSRYEGNFKQGKRSGRGTFFYVGGATYVGEWNDDVQCGFGTLSTDTSIYEGQFHNGQREGQGIHYAIDRELVFDGEWVNDAPRCGVYLSAAEFFAESDADADAHPDTDVSAVRAESLNEDTLVPSSLTQSQQAIEAKSLAAVRGTNALNLTTHSLTAAQRRKAFRLHFRPLPRLQLENPEEILFREMALVKEERRAARTLPFLDLDKMFGEEGLDDLRRIFGEADSDTSSGGSGGAGYVRPQQLLGMFQRLGFAMSLPDLAQLLVDAGKSGTSSLVSGVGLTTTSASTTSSGSAGSKKAELVSFVDFVKLAHLIDAKAALRAKQQQQQQQQQQSAYGYSEDRIRIEDADIDSSGKTSDYRYVSYSDGVQLKLGPNSFIHNTSADNFQSSQHLSDDQLTSELHDGEYDEYFSGSAAVNDDYDDNDDE